VSIGIAKFKALIARELGEVPEFFKNGDRFTAYTKVPVPSGRCEEIGFVDFIRV
jgi:hypothetical protein